jgi:glycosyltransferase involved in cell wall biosynthesis
MIAYGADIEDSVNVGLIAPFGVAPREYYLIVSRFIPENSLEAMLRGFVQSATTKRLVVVGGARYDDAFQQRIRALAESDSRIVLAGTMSDQAMLRELWCNCYAYLHGHSVGGTNPALLRAMGHGACVLARDTVFNREVLEETGLFFANESDVADGIARLDGDSPLVARLRASARERVRENYSWTMIADAYDKMFLDAAAR